VAFLGTLFFYFPEKHHQALAVPKMEIIKKIDFIGALLSIAGATLLWVIPRPKPFPMDAYLSF